MSFNLRFTEQYYPSLAELSPEALSSAREQVVRLLRPQFPDVDFSPGTPTGDLIISVLAAFWAATEESHSRLMSDLDLENVANGIIFSCDFVRAYLGNFSVYDVDNLRTSGLVRLTYNSPEPRLIQKSTRFRFTSDADYHLSLSNPLSTGISLLAAGHPHNGNPDTYALSQTSANSWSVDIPVTSNTSETVDAGTSGTINILPAELIGIVAAIEFRPGMPPASLHDLAKFARKIAHALTSSSAGGVRSLVLRNWPEMRMISPVVTGDAEMLRTTPFTPLVLQQPAMDLYVRSNHDMRVETQDIRLRYVTATYFGQPRKVFRGKLSLLHRPSRIRSIEWSGTTGESLVASSFIFATSSNNKLPDTTSFGSVYEDLYLEVVPEMNGDVPRIPLSEDSPSGTVEQYAMFRITYHADPMLETVASTLESPHNKPVGVSLVVRSGPLVDVTGLEVSYTKQPGVRMLLTAAREGIVNYFRAAGYPDVPTHTGIRDIMRSAGAGRVTDIAASGSVKASVALSVFDATLADPLGADIADDWHQAAFQVTQLSFNTFQTLVPATLVNIVAGSNPAEVNLWAATAKTARYHVEPEAITFIEV